LNFTPNKGIAGSSGLANTVAAAAMKFSFHTHPKAGHQKANAIAESGHQIFEIHETFAIL
jgi:hypothetical protein